MADPEFSPSEAMASIFSRWWLVVIMAVVGGVVGFGFHYMLPPLYQATASVTITMDFTQRELSQYEQDYAFNAAGAIINSTAVVDQIIDKSRMSGISISASDLKQQMFVEGRQSVWELHIRHHDPQAAAVLANIWVGVALDALNATLEQAIQVEQYQQQIASLQACLPFQPGVNQKETNPRPTPKECGRFSLKEIEAALNDWTEKLVQGKELTLGILPIMTFGLTGDASVPVNPVQYNQASLTLAGAAIGFVISLWIASSRKRERCG
jgi:capsular polysaccharide biosynthesis protein